MNQNKAKKIRDEAIAELELLYKVEPLPPEVYQIGRYHCSRRFVEYMGILDSCIIWTHVLDLAIWFNRKEDAINWAVELLYLEVLTNDPPVLIVTTPIKLKPEL